MPHQISESPLKFSLKVFVFLLRLGVCAMFAYIAYRQFLAKTWLQPHLVATFVEASPLGQVDDAFRGFIPLVEIIGGLAWVCYVTAPVALWFRSAGKYLAMVLIVLQILLAIFTPVTVWNWVMLAGPFLFLPSRWLTLNRETWSRERAALRPGWRNVGLLFILLVMLSTIFERNFVQQFTLNEKINSQTVDETYRMIAKPFYSVGNLILFNSIWKMYSPTWRHVVWIDWIYQKADGSSVNWPQENFSPDYRLNRRTWAESLWTDFKKEKVFVGMLSGERERVAYANYLCREIEGHTGVKPINIHPEIFSFDIRSPDEDWSLDRQKFENHQVEENIPCD